MNVLLRPILVLLFLFPFIAQANSYGYPYQPQQNNNQITEPARVLREGIELLTGYMDKENKPSDEELRQYLEIEILPYFDFERMAAWAVGPAGRQLNDAQKRQLTAILKERFLASMVGKLEGYNKGRIQYLRPKGNLSQGNVTLGVRIYSEQRYPVQIDFKLYNNGSGWKVYDVVANRTSAVSHYRREFNYLLRRYGVDGLITKAAGIK